MKHSNRWHTKHRAGWEELRMAVFRQAVSDHRRAKYKSRKAHIENWILSCPYQMDSEMCTEIVRRIRCS